MRTNEPIDKMNRQELKGQLHLPGLGPPVTGPCHAFDERGVLCIAPATVFEKTSGLGVCAKHQEARNLWCPKKRKMK